MEIVDLLRSLVGAELDSVQRYARAWLAATRGAESVRREWYRVRTERAWHLAQRLSELAAAAPGACAAPVQDSDSERELDVAERELDARYREVLVAATANNHRIADRLRGLLADRAHFHSEFAGLATPAPAAAPATADEVAPQGPAGADHARGTPDPTDLPEALRELAEGGPAGIPERLPALAKVLRHLLTSTSASEHFLALERCGVHVTPVHYYETIPDLGRLPPETWEAITGLPGIATQDAAQLELLGSLARYAAEVDALPVRPSGDPAGFHFANDAFSGLDAYVLYGIVRHFAPRRILEVGAGHSTRLLRAAARSLSPCEIVSIEPYPDPALAAGQVPGVQLIAEPVEKVGLAPFLALADGDVLFVDSSHVSRLGSDVNWLFLEVFPRLRPGVIVHVHDVFLPREYPKSWAFEGRRFWNEQYLLQAFLIGNRDFTILIGNSYLQTHHPDQVRAHFPRVGGILGGSFWMRKLH